MPRVTPEEFLKPNCLDVQHNENDKSQRASEYRKFRVVAWTIRRLFGQLISVYHGNHLGSEFNSLSMVDVRMRKKGVFTLL
jgi:hypothetical protein